MLEGIWWASYVALWVLVLAEAVVILALARQIGLLHSRIKPMGARVAAIGPAIGSLAPIASIKDMNGQAITIGGKDKLQTLLLFLAPKCPACSTLIPSLRTFQKGEKTSTKIIFVSIRGDENENQDLARKVTWNGSPFIVSDEVAETYGVHSAPYGVLIDSEGVVRAKGIANTLEQLESLINAIEIDLKTRIMVLS